MPPEPKLSLPGLSLACAIRPGIAAFPKALRVPAQDLRVQGPLGHWLRLDVRPRLRVCGFVEGEDVLEGAGGCVACGEGLAEVPGLAERGDQRGVSVLLVEHRSWLDPPAKR